MGRLVPMGDMVEVVRSNDSRSLGAAEKLENRGIWLKLLRGELETDPDDIGECGAMNAMASKLME